jgi:hypothetical protein
VGWLGGPAAPFPALGPSGGPAVPPTPLARAPRGWLSRRRHPPGGARLSATPPPNRLPLSLSPLYPPRAHFLPRAARFPLPLHLTADRNRPLDAGLVPRG